MAFTPENVADLSQLQVLSSHIVNILDKEATISSDVRQVTAGNIAKYNTALGHIVDKIDAIVTSDSL